VASFLSISKATSQNLENIIYCHENIDISRVYFVNSDQFVGHFYDHEDNYLLLFSPSNVIIDTFKIGNNANDFLQDINVLGNNLISANTLNHKILLSIKPNGFVEMVKMKRSPERVLVFEFNDLVISTISLKNSKRNESFETEVDYKGHKQLITKGVDRKYKNQHSSFLPSKLQYDRKNARFYKVLEEAGVLYTIGIDGDTKSYLFPDKSEEGKSWNVLFDHQSNQLFGMLFSNKKEYEVYELTFDDTDTIQLKMVMIFNEEPLAIFNRKIIYNSLEKNETGKKILCYYGVEITR
jgi:hypothetical protein